MLKIRLRRMGSAHRPFYRVVVADSRRVPTSSAVEEVGHFDPTGSQRIAIDVDRVNHWVGQGAQVSPTVRRLLKQQTTSAS